MIAVRLFRTSRRDALVLGASLVHGSALVMGLAVAAAAGPPAKAAVALLLAIAMCWSANTVSHIHLHAPLFRCDAANRAFSLYLTALLAVPQTWWKLRHLEHHGLQPGTGARAHCLGPAGWLEIVAALAVPSVLMAFAPGLCTAVYLPAMLAGFGLCALQGQQEHRRSDAGVDHHGRLYNRLWFNDGFHAAHHRAPGAHWTTLPAGAATADLISALPPILRWTEALPTLANRLAAAGLDALESATLGIRPVRRFLLSTHTRAWHALLEGVDTTAIRTVTVVGGGLFPRTTLVLLRLLPKARLTVVDASSAHLARARARLATDAPDAYAGVQFVVATYDPNAAAPTDADLVVIPLAFRGDRAGLYRKPPAPLLAVHDWGWRARGQRSVVVSPLLLKRLNLVRDPDRIA